MGVVPRLSHKVSRVSCTLIPLRLSGFPLRGPHPLWPDVPVVWVLRHTFARSLTRTRSRVGWAPPVSLAATMESIFFLSSAYLDVSVRRVPPRQHYVHVFGYLWGLTRWGFPIQRSPDHAISLLPKAFPQLITVFSSALSAKASDPAPFLA